MLLEKSYVISLVLIPQVAVLLQKQMGEVKVWLLRLSEEYLGSEKRKESNLNGETDQKGYQKTKK